MKPASAKPGLQKASQPIGEIYSVIGLAFGCSLFAKRSSDGPETRPNKRIQRSARSEFLIKL